MNSKITLFTTGCPKCNVLKKKLDAAGIEYIIITDVKQMRELGILSAPMLKVDNKMLTFMEAVEYINNGGLK